MTIIQSQIPGRPVPAGRPNIARTSLRQHYRRGGRIDVGASKHFNGGIWKVTKRQTNKVYIEKTFNHDKHCIASLDKTFGFPAMKSGALWEMTIHRRLDHPHIVEYHDSCIDVGQDKLIGHLYMEYCDQGSLQDRRIDNPAPLPELHMWEFVLSVLNAFGYLHTGAPNMLDGIMNDQNQPWESMFHADFADRNVFVKTQEGTDIPQYKLADFGLTRYVVDVDNHLPAWPISRSSTDMAFLNTTLKDFMEGSRSPMFAKLRTLLGANFVGDLIDKRKAGEHVDYRKLIIDAVREAFDPEMGGVLAYMLPYDQEQRNKSLVARVVDSADAPHE